MIATMNPDRKQAPPRRPLRPPPPAARRPPPPMCRPGSPSRLPRPHRRKSDAVASRSVPQMSPVSRYATGSPSRLPQMQRPAQHRGPARPYRIMS